MKYILRALALLVGLPVVLVLLFWASVLIRAGDPEDREPYFVDHSPDGRYKIVVVYEPTFWKVFSISMPGQGGVGESPGIIMLMDEQGRVLRREKYEMMQTIHGAIVWADDSVGIVSIGAWPLPAKIANE